MHTYIRQDKDHYVVGLWLLHPDKYHRFEELFTVPSLKQAMVAVNMLNGGTRVSTDALHLKEKE
jgi:hypothetical protein